MKLAFISFYLKINAHLLFIQVKTEKEYLKQGGTLTEQVSQTCSSSFSCSCPVLFSWEHQIKFFISCQFGQLKETLKAPESEVV